MTAPDSSGFFLSPAELMELTSSWELAKPTLLAVRSLSFYKASKMIVGKRSAQPF